VRQACDRTQRIAVTAAGNIFMLMGRGGQGGMNDGGTKRAREIKMRARKQRKCEINQDYEEKHPT